MIYKRCGKCNARIPTGTECPRCSQIKREYAPRQGIRKQYAGARWKKLAQVTMSRYGYIDLLARSEGKIIPAEIVHHITPTSDDPKRFYDTGNLIPVSRASHDRIHAAYKASDAEKRAMQRTLYKLVQSAEKCGETAENYPEGEPKKF